MGAERDIPGMRSAPTHGSTFQGPAFQGSTFDAFGEPVAALPAAERAGSARTIGIVAFWLVAVLLVAGRVLVPVPSFDRAPAPPAVSEGAAPVAQEQGPALR